MLTEAVCARHQLCCSKEERHAAESGREKNREQWGEAARDGGRWEGEMGCAPFALTSTAQLISITMMIKEMTRDGRRRKLQRREMDERAVCKVKRLFWMLY